MGKWGPNYNLSFNVTALTANFADNSNIADTPTVIQAFLYVDYVKGNEDRLEILVEESNREDDEPPSTERYYMETIADNDGFVEPYIFKFTESGSYRIPIQVGESEDRIRVSVRGAGTPPFSGTANLYYAVR